MHGSDTPSSEHRAREYLEAPAAPRYRVSTNMQLLTIRFSAEDWLSVRFAESPAPLMETVLGIADLRRHPGGRGRWRSRARRAFPSAARPLLDLISASGPWPDFLDPITADIDEAIESVTATPEVRLRHQLKDTWRGAQRPPAWLKALAAGEKEAMHTLTQGLRAAYMACVAPHWPEITASFRQDQAERMAVLAEGGLGEVLGTLHPDLALRDGALERTSDAILGTCERHLDGSGLQILPSVLWSGPPLFAFCSAALGGSAVIYGSSNAAPGTPSPREPDSLAPLIGRARAAMLEALREPCGTVELAARVGIGAPSASEHAAVLRDADLILTVRSGRGVRHSLTPLGRSLLKRAGGGNSALPSREERG
jgi:DNA-binding transcriptional ArsR family regulator